MQKNISTVSESLLKILKSIKTTNELKNFKEELQNVIQNEFDFNNINNYLNDINKIIYNSYNENESIQKQFINNLKENIDNLIKTLDLTNNFNNSNNLLDNNLSESVNAQLIDITNALETSNLNSIYNSIDIISKSIKKFKEDKENNEINLKLYLKDMIEYSQKAQYRLNEMEKLLELQEIELSIDQLTQVFNRRHFEKSKIKIYTNFLKTKQLHIVVADIDNFKSINDNYGHQKGDYVLKSIANIIKKITNDTGKVFRYGGEEFVLIFENIDQKTSLTKIIEIKNYLNNNKLIISENNKLNITLSFGFHSLENGQSFDDGILNADQKLYIAKNTGKNKIVCVKK